MISLKTAVSEWDRLDALFDACTRSYRVTVAAMKDHAVEIDPDLLKQHRVALGTLSKQLDRFENAAEVLAVGSAIREELSAYQSKARDLLEKLHTELSSATGALQTMIESFSENDVGHEQRVKASLARLGELASSERLTRLCPDLGAAVQDLEATVQTVLDANHLVIAQLKDEISTLHRAFDQRLAPPSEVRLSQLHSRKEIEAILETELKHCRPVTAILLLISNWRHLEQELSPEGYANLICELAERLKQAAVDGSPVGQWSDSDFLQVTHLQKSEAMRAAKAWCATLPKPYPFVQEGRTIRLDLRLKTAVVWSKEGKSYEDFIADCDLFCKWRAVRTDLPVSGLRVS